MLDEVKLFLKYFEKTYQKRNIEDLEEFMSIFFSKDAYVFGTSTNEIFPTYEAIKSCIRNDWLYWGELYIKRDQLDVRMIGDDVLVHVLGSVVYTFSDEAETDQKFVKLMEILNEDVDINDENHLSYQHHEMSYILDHYLSKREDQKRINHVPLSLSFVLTFDNDALKIKSLSYDVLTLDDYPDAIMHPYTPYEGQFNEDMNNLKTHGKAIKFNPFELDIDKDFYVVDTDGNIKYDQSSLNDILNQYDNLEVDMNHVLLTENKEYISFMTIGKARLNRSELEIRNSLKSKLSAIIQSDLDDKSKLFKIRRHISLTDKICALAPQLVYPLKIMGVISVNQNENKLKMLKISYPMDIILEDKYI